MIGSGTSLPLSDIEGAQIRLLSLVLGSLPLEQLAELIHFHYPECAVVVAVGVHSSRELDGLLVGFFGGWIEAIVQIFLGGLVQCDKFRGQACTGTTLLDLDRPPFPAINLRRSLRSAFAKA